MFVPLGALNFLLSLFIVDVGLPDEKEAANGAQSPNANEDGDLNQRGEPEAILVSEKAGH